MDPERSGNLGGCMGYLRVQAAGGNDDGIDIGRLQTRLGQRFCAGPGTHRDDGVVHPGKAPLGDPYPAADPLVIGVHDLRELVIGDDAVRAVMAQPGNLRAGGAGPVDDLDPRPWRGHSRTPECSATKSAALSSSAGVFSAMVATPFRSRRISPT